MYNTRGRDIVHTYTVTCTVRYGIRLEAQKSGTLEQGTYNPSSFSFSLFSSTNLYCQITFYPLKHYSLQTSPVSFIIKREINFFFFFFSDFSPLQKPDGNLYHFVCVYIRL